MKRSLKTKSDIIFQIVNTAILLLILVIVLYPLVFVISASFSNPLEVLRGEVWLWPKGFNLQAYKDVFSHRDIMTGYKNTIMYTLVGVLVNIILTVFAAYPLSRKDLYGRNFFTAFFTFTMFFSGGLIPTYMVIQSLGLINNFWVMILPGAVGMYNIIIVRTFFSNSIPIELEEAAFIDGCSNIGILLRIVLPLSKAVIAVMVLFYGVGHWNAFFNALIYLSDRSKYPLQLILREILVQEQASQQIEALENQAVIDKVMRAETIKYALIIVANIPVLIVYPFLQKYFVQGVMIGAIKG